MTLIEKPVAGQPMRAGWGAAVADRLNQLAAVGAPGMLVRDGAFGQGFAPTPKNQRDRRGTSAAPQPFEVRWDPALAEGEGGWKIYLPGEHLLSVDGEYVDAFEGVTAIEDSNGDETGWFEFDEIDSSATAIWLVVAKEDSGSGGEETVAAQFADDEDAEASTNICIAEVSYTAAQGSAPAVVEIKQAVVGSIVVGAGTQVTGEAVTNGCFALVVETEEPAQEGDDPVTTAHFANRYFNYSNITLECADLTLSAGGVFVALKITTTASYPTPTASIVSYSTLAALQGDQRALGYVVIPIYHLDSDFSILCDFRVAPMTRSGEVL